MAPVPCQSWSRSLPIPNSHSKQESVLPLGGQFRSSRWRHILNITSLAKLLHESANLTMIDAKHSGRLPIIYTTLYTVQNLPMYPFCLSNANHEPCMNHDQFEDVSADWHMLWDRNTNDFSEIGSDLTSWPTVIKLSWHDHSCMGVSVVYMYCNLTVIKVFVIGQLWNKKMIFCKTVLNFCLCVLTFTDSFMLSCTFLLKRQRGITFCFYIFIDSRWLN